MNIKEILFYRDESKRNNSYSKDHFFAMRSSSSIDCINLTETFLFLSYSKGLKKYGKKLL